MGELGASCFHTLSDEQREVSLPEWDAERVGMICTKSDDFAHWKATILKLCYISKRCSYNSKKKIIKFFDEGVGGIQKKQKLMETYGTYKIED